MSHATLAASEQTFVRIFEKLRDEFVFAKQDTANFGPFTAGYDVRVKLKGGDVDLRADNTVKVKELDLKWERLRLSLSFNIDEICVGGFCIIWIPFLGCQVEAPEICVFSDNPDISITLPLDNLITSEISVLASLKTRNFLNPNRPSGLDDWEASEQGPPVPNEWHVLLDPITIDLDVFDVADIVGDLLENAVNAVIDNLLGWLPGWAKDVIRAILGPVIDLIRDILDIADDIQEWISDLLRISFGLVDFILTFVADYLADKHPLLRIENAFPAMPQSPNPNDPSGPALAQVRIPLQDLSVFNTDSEMIVNATIGA